MQADPFGIEIEKNIANSGVRNIFTPHTPINSLELFLGRSNEVKEIISQINTPGQHSLLYGDRGVGKSSLANIASLLLFSSKIVSGRLYRYRCDSKSTFEAILNAPLIDAGVDQALIETTEKHTQGGGAGANIPFLNANIKSDRETSKTRKNPANSLSPQKACAYLKDVQGLLVIDELDAIKSKEEKKLLAEFIKHLSDEAGRLKVMVVGIARTAAELTAGHPSVSRCLKETKLKKMADPELRDIIEKGSDKLGIKFDTETTNAIVELSAGYPHFTHLLALKCAENAIANNKQPITKIDLKSILDSAVKNAEESLRRKYDEATVSHSTEMYRLILCAASTITEPQFTASALRDAYQEITRNKITQNAINNYLKRLVSTNDESILHRIAKGVYRFNDPRMPSYIRIANNIIH